MPCNFRFGRCRRENAGSAAGQHGKWPFISRNFYLSSDRRNAPNSTLKSSLRFSTTNNSSSNMANSCCNAKLSLEAKRRKKRWLFGKTLSHFILRIENIDVGEKRVDNSMVLLKKLIGQTILSVRPGPSAPSGNGQADSTSVQCPQNLAAEFA